MAFRRGEGLRFQDPWGVDGFLRLVSGQGLKGCGFRNKARYDYAQRMRYPQPSTLIYSQKQREGRILSYADN